MQIDPVVAVMDEIERAYRALSHARDHADAAAIKGELARIAMLQVVLHQTTPTSVIGAAMLLREAAGLLPVAASPNHAEILRQIAGRLDQGVRAIGDLKWLRQLIRELASGADSDPGRMAGDLVHLALKGAARPVLLWRAVAPPRHSQIAAPRASLWVAS